MTRLRLWILLYSATLGALAMTGRADSAADASRFVEQSGIQGGLVVCIGCDDADFVAALRPNDRYLVHALDTDSARVEAVREALLKKGLYGPISADTFDGKHLPYADNLVNLLVVSQDACRVSREDVTRVLAPRGVSLTRSQPTIRKPVPTGIDEWTHYLHGPDNNAVAKDSVVGPPSRLQWIADPIHLRSHEHLNSISAVVSARGRVFTVIDEGPVSSVAAAPAWRLVARDAFNGLLLWKQKLGPWEGHFRLFRSGPPDVARRLVAGGDCVYVTLGYGKNVAAFDGATGEKLRDYAGTEGALEIVSDQGSLFVVVGDLDLTPNKDTAKRYHPAPAPRRKGVVALDASSGRERWNRRDADTSELMPTTLAVADGKVLFQNTRQIICLDAASGKALWRADRPVYTKRLSWSAPTLVVKDGVVLSADGSSGGLRGIAPKGGERVEWIMSDQDIRRHPEGDLVALDVKTGKTLWTSKSLQGFCNPGDVFVIGDRVWAGANVGTGQVGLNVALDLRTGTERSRMPKNGLPVAGHTRCYRDRATERFLVLGGIGTEFVKLDDWNWNANLWVRGTCQYGVMPCNGLLYVPSDSCGCRPEMRIHGFTAMAAASQGSGIRSQESERLEKGPAYGTQVSALISQPSDAWPTYRADTSRSGTTPATVPAKLKAKWTADLGGKLTSLTASGNKVFLSRVDTHTVYALDTATGKVAWRRTVGGAVDSPPTVHGNLVLFGAHDGKVYCLGSEDGARAWSFRAAPEERHIVAHERVESAWPVHGSVLVQGDLAWFTAGRSPYLDGGTRLYALDAKSGKVVVDRQYDALGPQEFHSAKQQGGSRPAPPVQPDILSAAGGLVYARWNGFDSEGNLSKAVKPHLFSATGFLDDTWWHRTYWQYGTWMRGGFGGWPQAARVVPAGRVMVVGKDTLFGYGRLKYDPGNPRDVHAGHVGVVKDGYQDEGRIARTRNPYGLYATSKPGGGGGKQKGRPKEAWRITVPILVRAMVLADKTLFVAGPNDDPEHLGLAQLGQVRPGALSAVNPGDGSILAECQLPAAPVLDGMIALPGRLLLSGVDGSVTCLSGN